MRLNFKYLTHLLSQEKNQKRLRNKKYTSNKISLYKMWKKMAFNLNQLKMLKNESVKNKIDFICSVFDKESLDNVLKLNQSLLRLRHQILLTYIY